MDKQQIIKGVKIAISNVSNTTPGKIKKKDKLSKYIPALAKLALVSSLHNIFENADITDLTNALFDSITTVDELINHIISIYEN